MKFSKRLLVPLCDIMVHIQDGLENFSGESDNESKKNLSLKTSQSVVKMQRTRQTKREREEHENDIKRKRRGRPRMSANIKKKNKSDVELDSESDSEKDNSFKENEEGNEISEYEKMVQKNREERMAFLESIKINEVKEEFKQSVQSIAPRPKPKKNNAFKKHKVTEVTPLRKSRRLAKLDVDLSEKALYAKAVAEATSEQEVKSNYRRPKNFHQHTSYKKLDYKPSTFYKNIDNKPSTLSHNQDTRKPLPPKYPFEEAISVRDDFSEFVTNFDFNVDENIKFNTDYASNFKNMKIGESGVAKVVPARVTSLAIHPAADKIMVIAADKFGHIGFWNVTSNLHPILFLPHQGGVTNLKVNPHNSLQIISSSYDGTLRCGDMINNSFDEIYNVSDETSCTYFDFVSATTILVSQRNGNVSVVDVRNESEKKHECHDYAVKTVHVHPENKNMFLTADSKGNMKLWDLRKLQKKAIIEVSHHKRSCSSAFFSSATGKYILTTSADDSLCIFDSTNLEKELLFKKSIKHNNWTGRWLTPFKATWLPHSDELFSVGSMNHPRRIEIYNANGNNMFNFTDEEYLNSVTSANEFHSSLNVLAGGNSSGKVFIFADTQLNL